MTNFISQLALKLLEKIRVRTPVGGLEISDSALRFSLPGIRGWDVYNQRLPLGVIEDGIIKDQAKFQEAVLALKQSLASRYGQRKIPVVVSLASSQIYTQAFLLPLVREGEVEKAIDLNLKMISPINFSEVYSGWQYLKKDDVAGRSEILGAFLRQSIVQDIDKALEMANFRPLALESRALSLARLVRTTQTKLNADRPVVVLSVDDEGIHLLVIKKGNLYFEYTELWKNLYEPGKSITMEEFRSAIKRSVQQLVNFYGQRWPEPLGEFLIIAPSLVSEVIRLLKEDFSFEATELSFSDSQGVKGEWFASIGAAERGSSIGAYDQELSLLGRTAQQKFGRERFVDFLSFWSVIVPVALVFILFFAFSADFFIIRETRRLEETVARRLSPSDRARIAELEDQATRFNNQVALVQSIRSVEQFKSSLITDILNRASSSQISVSNLRLEGSGSLSLAGAAASEDRIIAFKNNLKEGNFQNINLPLAGIRKDGQGYVFSISFSWTPSKTP